jgi:single-strand DNA-binding protein
MGANQVVLFGNCGKDPACKNVGENQTLIAEFSLATSKPSRTKGKWDTTWHTVKAFGNTADKIQRLLRKGDFVAVNGEIEVESWQGQDQVKKYRTVIKVMWPDSICIEQRDGKQSDPNDQREQW